MPGNHANSERSDLLGFYAEDHRFVKELAEAVRSLISRSTTTPEQIWHLAKLLFALDRLPRPTPGLCIELTFGQNHENGERNHLQLTLDDTGLRLDKVLYIILDPNNGGDTTSETVFEVEGKHRDITHPTALMDWVEEFRGHMESPEQQLEISDDADGSGINWDAEANDEDWEYLASDYA